MHEIKESSSSLKLGTASCLQSRKIKKSEEGVEAERVETREKRLKGFEGEHLAQESTSGVAGDLF